MWVDKLEDEESKKQTIDTGEGPSIGAGAGGGAPQIQGSTTATVGTPSSISPTPETPGQKFGTIQDYFKGNKTQGEQLGQQFTSKLEDTKQAQQGIIGQAAEKATGQIAANTIGFDQGLVSKAVADPTKVANDEDQYNQFMKQWNAAYKGPESFESAEQYSTAAKAAKAAQDKATQIGSTGGRQQLLQDEFGVYGQGNKGLDEALLQQSSYFPGVQEQGKQFNTVQDYLQAKSKSIKTAAQAANETTENTKAQTRSPFATSLTDFQTDLKSRTSAAQNKAKEVLSRYQTDLASADPVQVQNDLKEAGVDRETIKNIVYYLQALNKDYSLNPNIPSSYIGNPNVDINPGTVASQEDYNKATALNKLTGVDYSGVLNPADISKAGTGTFPQQAFKSPDLETYLKQTTDIQDKSILQKQSQLSGDIRANEHLIEQYIDAAARQGIKPTNEQELKTMLPGLYNLYNSAKHINNVDTPLGASLRNVNRDDIAQPVIANINKFLGGSQPSLPTEHTPMSSTQIQNKITELQSEMAALSKTTTNKNDLNTMLSAYNNEIAYFQQQLKRGN